MNRLNQFDHATVGLSLVSTELSSATSSSVAAQPSVGIFSAFPPLGLVVLASSILATGSPATSQVHYFDGSAQRTPSTCVVTQRRRRLSRSDVRSLAISALLEAEAARTAQAQREYNLGIES